MPASDAVDHYAVLGVSESAAATEIRRAYLGLARAHHPDFHEAGDEAARSANKSPGAISRRSGSLAEADGS